MKSQYNILLFLMSQFLWSVEGNCQTPLVTVCPLPNEIDESSGIEIGKDNTYWTHNDSGDKPYLYQIDQKGRLIKKVLISNALGVDIEDIAVEEDKFMYAADIGNNKNDRKNLVIYKIKLSDLYTNDAVDAEEIKLRYPDQNLFPPESTERNFDCEAIFHYNHHLYLFTKSRGESLYTKCYELPDVKGDYTAKLIDSFQTGNWVTGADISPSKNKVALICGSVVFVFSEFKGTNFFKGKIMKTVLNATQKEGIVFETDKKLVISDEKNKDRNGNIYILNIDNEKLFTPNIDRFSIDPSPCDKKLFIAYNEIETKNYKIDIRNIDDNQFMLNETIEVKPKFTKKFNLMMYNDGNYSITFHEVDGKYLLKLLFSVKHQ